MADDPRSHDDRENNEDRERRDDRDNNREHPDRTGQNGADGSQSGTGGAGSSGGAGGAGSSGGAGGAGANDAGSNGNSDANGPSDPLSQMFNQLFGGATPLGFSMHMGPGMGAGMGSGSGDDDPRQQPDFNAIFGQLQHIFGALAQGNSGGPVNWNIATESAEQVLGSDDPKVTDEERHDVEEAAHLAGMWLNEVTSFEAPAAQPQILRRSEWIKKTLPDWQRLTEPVARRASEAVSHSLNDQMPEEARALLGQAGSFLTSLGSTMFGAQLGQAVGSMASETFGGTDVGLPMAGRGFALVPANAKAFGEGLAEPYLEAATVRLFNSVEWLEDHVVALVTDFAEGISMNTSAIHEQLDEIDPFNPSAFQEVLQSGMLEPTKTPQQEAALARLETTLALIEGWVDSVVTQAAHRLPSAPALREMIRRRRATGGPKELAFAGLVGLEMRPRRARDASAVWEFIAQERGNEARDEAWADMASLPTAEDLDDPTGYFERRALLDASDEDFDAAVSAWLDGTSAGGGDSSNGGDSSDGGASDNDQGEDDSEK